MDMDLEEVLSNLNEPGVSISSGAYFPDETFPLGDKEQSGMDIYGSSFHIPVGDYNFDSREMVLRDKYSLDEITVNPRYDDEIYSNSYSNYLKLKAKRVPSYLDEIIHNFRTADYWKTSTGISTFYTLLIGSGELLSGNSLSTVADTRLSAAGVTLTLTGFAKKFNDFVYYGLFGLDDNSSIPAKFAVRGIGNAAYQSLPYLGILWANDVPDEVFWKTYFTGLGLGFSTGLPLISFLKNGWDPLFNWGADKMKEGHSKLIDVFPEIGFLEQTTKEGYEFLEKKFTQSKQTFFNYLEQIK